jgi:hypothetical protein
MDCLPGKEELEQHLTFIEEYYMLALEFSWRFRKHYETETLSSILEKHSMLIEVPGTKGIFQKIIASAGNPENFDDFREVMLKFLPEIKGNVADAYPESLKIPDAYHGESLRYDAPLESLPRNHCNFHICNAVKPKSIFDDPDYLPSSMLRLLDAAEKEYGYDTLRTFTWMNSYPKWLRLFPEEWQANMSAPNQNIGNNLGFWGQVINAQGNINRPAADYLFEHGRFRYQPRSSQCSFHELRKHLKREATI